MTRFALLAAVPLALLAGCADPTPADADPVAADAVQDPVLPADPSASGTPGAMAQAGEPLVPEEMTAQEWRKVDLAGELGCSFARSADDSPLLLASSFVDESAGSQAALKLGGKVVKLETEGKGGFDALSKGARFVGPGGLYANVVRSGSEPIPENPQIAMESPRYTGLMVLSRGGQELSIDGIWECGP